jgi:hypothetical protein
VISHTGRQRETALRGSVAGTLDPELRDQFDNRRYEGNGVLREYVAEAIRAYLVNPNYLKTVAPKTAAAIRAAVNGHPRLSRILQFNTVGSFGVLRLMDLNTVGEDAHDSDRL